MGLETGVCSACQKPLIGRSDKKFCDVLCRNVFHNKNKSYGEQYIEHTQRLLRYNRKVLKTLSPNGKATVRKDVLDQMGYDFRYFTSVFKSSKNVYYLVHDYAFSPIWEGDIKKVLIVKRQDYMDKLSFDIWKK